MFNFTKEEKIALLFLSICFLLGIVVSYLKQCHFLDFINYDDKLKHVVVSKDVDRAIKQAKTVNINTASKKELTLLPGIGPSTAEKIIIYRNQYGFFNSLDELKAVKGIGDKKIERLREFTTF